MMLYPAFSSTFVYPTMLEETTSAAHAGGARRDNRFFETIA